MLTDVDSKKYSNMTRSQYRGKYHSGRFARIYVLKHLKGEIHSFPTMYNTWGCSLGRNKPKNDGLKSLNLAEMVLDHPTWEWAGTHNVQKYDTSALCKTSIFNIVRPATT